LIVAVGLALAGCAPTAAPDSTTPTVGDGGPVPTGVSVAADLPACNVTPDHYDAGAELVEAQKVPDAALLGVDADIICAIAFEVAETEPCALYFYAGGQPLVDDLMTGLQSNGWTAPNAGQDRVTIPAGGWSWTVAFNLISGGSQVEHEYSAPCSLYGLPPDLESVTDLVQVVVQGTL
jgi:hypothetical protein